MEINQESIKKIIDVFQKKRNAIVKGCVKGFNLYQTNTGRKIVTAQLKNKHGWYALVCLYDCPGYIADIYDRHVFDRYQERRMKDNKDKDVIKEFILRGNANGTLIKKDERRFEKKIRDGATMGTAYDDIFYHKTYITDDMITENKMDYLFELEEKLC